MIKSTTTTETLVQCSPSEIRMTLESASHENASEFASQLAWSEVIQQAFGHRIHLVVSRRDGRTVGFLPLAEMKSLLFGKFLVSLPYVNTAGIWAKDCHAANQLIDRAVQLADSLDVRFLELRQEKEYPHPSLQHQLDSKAVMRLSLPDSAEKLWDQFKSKLRSQIRSGMKHEFSIHWGKAELLDDFYRVFSRKMRDLGTPVYGKGLFRTILKNFPQSAEICCVKSDNKPVAAALLIHSAGKTEVPSASSLGSFNSTNVNMLMYWHLLQRAISRESSLFDFGRSTIGGGTYRFKKQWGASPSPSIWQYYVRKGSFDELRPENKKFSLAIAAWRRLPVAVTQWIGPTIVRGIP